MIIFELIHGENIRDTFISEQFYRNVLPFLGVKDILSLCQTNQTYRQICKDDDFWFNVVSVKFPGAGKDKPHHTNWKQFYLLLEKRKISKAKRFDITTEQLKLEPADNVADLAQENGLEYPNGLAEYLTKFIKASPIHRQISKGDAVWVSDFDYRNDGRHVLIRK